MSLGTISALEATTAQAVSGPVASWQAQASASLDETGWREGGKRAWLWVAVTTWVTVRVVRLSRGGQVARELLGETFHGIQVENRHFKRSFPPPRVAVR